MQLTLNFYRPVQELILPRRATLYYGDIPITFEKFQKFFEMADTVKAIIGDTHFSKLASEETYIGARRVSTIRTQYWQGRQATLPELLWSTQYHKVRESIIKVYAVAGLLNFEEQDSLWVSLDRASSTSEKFVAVAVWILQKYQNLDIFSYASCRRWEVDQRPANIPTWVPNFGFEGRSIEPMIYGTFGPKDFNDIYNAAGTVAAKFSISDDNLLITVAGIRIDHISLLEEPFTGQESNWQLSNLFKRAEACGLGIKSTPSMSPLEAFWRTLRLDQRNGQRLQSSDVELVDLAIQNDEDCALFFQKDGLFNLQSCKGRRLLMSSEGYICLAPVEARAGDIITVFLGGKVPYLLRESGEDFELVGEWSVSIILERKR
jgi:hypothetical protein